MILEVATSVTEVQERAHNSLLTQRLREMHAYCDCPGCRNTSPVEKRAAATEGRTVFREVALSDVRPN
jgi:hypothetical protein